MSQKIADEYLKARLVLTPGDRFHHLVAMLFDTWIDDVTDDRIEELERQVESWRWCNAQGGRVE